MALIKDFKKGFSLIELMVAVGLFATVATIAIGALLGLSTAQKKAFYIQTNQDNVRYALETMAREMRTGVCYKQSSSDDSNVCFGFSTAFTSTPNACGGPSSCIQFVNSRREVVVYKHVFGSSDQNQTDCGVNPHVAGLTVSCIAKKVDGSEYFPVTAREVRIQNLQFKLIGQDSSLTNNYQPRVIISLTADTPGVGSLNTKLDAQTTVTQLQLDNGNI